MLERPTDESFNNIRKNIKSIASNLLEIKNVYSGTDAPSITVENKGEVIANLMLAYRHLEDASMRLGKAIQAYDGGVSVYDKSSTVGA